MLIARNTKGTKSTFIVGLGGKKAGPLSTLQVDAVSSTKAAQASIICLLFSTKSLL